MVEEQGAARGYIVTTANFTDEARASAQLSAKIVLVDVDGLVDWHRVPPII